uniref:Alpha/beta hydrolase fold-5 domain-containing protein n=1 Tax=Physcomitrium patens TaxID=3218 RepID=A0A2K1KCT4_PHYPA|nr:hypothetical protein PHYPA_010783 [Physcomitrium patens]
MPSLSRSKWLLEPFAIIVLVAAIAVATAQDNWHGNKERENFQFSFSEQAADALRSQENLSAEYVAGIGYAFLGTNATVSSILRGPKMSRGLVIMPEAGVAPEAYAPFARVVALYGYHATIVERPTPELVIKAMMLQPQLQYWILAGHGNGGTVAAHVAVTLHPKVEALILLASPLPRDVNLKLLNLLLVVAYSENDTLVTSAAVKRSFSRMADVSLTSPQSITTLWKKLASLYLYAVSLSHWAGAIEKALSCGDNMKIIPGRNDSKPYPGDIRVKFAEVPMNGTNANAIFDSNHPLFSGVPTNKWAIAGHSAGGLAASLYASRFRHRIYAAVLHAGAWAANFTQSDLPVVQIYGTLDDIGRGGYDRYRYRNTDPPPEGSGPLVNLETSKFVPLPVQITTKAEIMGIRWLIRLRHLVWSNNMEHLLKRPLHFLVKCS